MKYENLRNRALLKSLAAQHEEELKLFQLEKLAALKMKFIKEPSEAIISFILMNFKTVTFEDVATFEDECCQAMSLNQRNNYSLDLVHHQLCSLKLNTVKNSDRATAISLAYEWVSMILSNRSQV